MFPLQKRSDFLKKHIFSFNYITYFVILPPQTFSIQTVRAQTLWVY